MGMAELNHFDILTCDFTSLCMRVSSSFCFAFVHSFCTLKSCTVDLGQLDSMTLLKSFTALYELARINKKKIK